MALQQQLFQHIFSGKGSRHLLLPGAIQQVGGSRRCSTSVILPAFVPGGPRRQLGLAHDAIGERVAMVATGGNAVFGTIWESAIKAHAKTGVLPADALNQGIFAGGIVQHHRAKNA
jgi:hypothetical protein